MRPAERLELISNFSQEVADQFGISIVDVKFGQEGKKRTLEVSIFRAEPQVSLSDCEQFSRILETKLDEQAAADAPIADGAYSLIVQSPGIDRVLKTDREFQVFAGQKVQVQTKEKVLDLGVKFVAVLLVVTPEEINLAHAQPLSTKPVKGSKKEEPESETPREDITLKRSIISEVRLFAPDLQPRGK